MYYVLKYGRTGHDKSGPYDHRPTDFYRFQEVTSVMISNLIAKVFGTKHDRDIKRILPIVEEINERAEEYAGLADEQLPEKTVEFKERIQEAREVAEEEIKQHRSYDW